MKTISKKTNEKIEKIIKIDGRKNLIKLLKDTNIYLKRFLNKPSNSKLVLAYEVWFVSRWKKD